MNMVSQEAQNNVQERSREHNALEIRGLCLSPDASLTVLQGTVHHASLFSLCFDTGSFWASLAYMAEFQTNKSLNKNWKKPRD